MILLTFRHGLRAGEICDLRWEQVDFKTANLHVRRVKNGTPSTHPLTGRELRALRKHLRAGRSGRPPEPGDVIVNGAAAEPARASRERRIKSSIGASVAEYQLDLISTFSGTKKSRRYSRNRTGAPLLLQAPRGTRLEPRTSWQAAGFSFL
jgi:integrase